MRVIILGQSMELENHPSSIGELFTIIEEKLKKTGLIFSSLTIDGTEITADYAQYLISKINEIKVIEVGTKSFRTLLAETLGSAAEYLERVLPAVEKLGDEFYRGPTEDTWQKFAQLLEGGQWLLEVVTTVDGCTFKEENGVTDGAYAEWGKEFGEKSQAIEKAMENSDHVMIGDLLQYELIPLLSSLSKLVKQTLAEGLSNDLN